MQVRQAGAEVRGPAGAFEPRWTDPDAFERLIRPRLLRLKLPARYIGREQGEIRKDWDSTALKFCYCFPDIYELGMSYHGREVLYQRLNARPDTLCERAFHPDRDMEALQRELSVPLWSLESKRPLRDFDAIGISFTYEMAYATGLGMLDLAGIALRTADRGEDDPIVIAGGQCMCNPEPVAPFFDVICNGEGEETLEDILDCLLATRGLPRAQRLRALARVLGAYVPSLYAPRCDELGRFVGTFPTVEGLSVRVQRRFVSTFAEVEPPLNPVQPYIEVPGDKVYLEVMRGCPQGCRFCQAGYITRPARARPAELLAQAAAAIIRNTGQDEVSLMSLSTLDHPEVFELIRQVKAALPEHVNVSLPSLRADRMSAELAILMRRPKEGSLTIAVEAGSDSARRAIRKGVSEEDVLFTFDMLMAAGWSRFKLYFMNGFAGEPIGAMDEIAALVGKLLDLARDKGYRRPKLTISMSVLVPKPHTPLQWQAMESTELTREKQRRLSGLLNRFGGSVKYKYHDAWESVIETLLSRGGRNVADAIEAACYAGQTLPSDHFDWRVWVDVCQATGVDLQAEVFTDWDYEVPLPWDHISRGVGRRYLWREWEYYHSGDANPACHVECTNCGVGCAAPVFDAQSRAVPAGLKSYFAKIATQGEAAVRGLRPFSPVYPEELAALGHGDAVIELEPGRKPRVNLQRRGTAE